VLHTFLFFSNAHILYGMQDNVGCVGRDHAIQ
jgi:hypothetical protein